MNLKFYVYLCAILCIAAMSGVAIEARKASSSQAPEARATAYLSVEVPRWHREHPCFSCHNNGEGVKALMLASRRGIATNGAEDETKAWLKVPEQWDAKSPGPAAFQRFARIQFASTLAMMVENGEADQPALKRAAEFMLPEQQKDGAWRINSVGAFALPPDGVDKGDNLGSPAAYGTTLATASARLVLARVKSDETEAALANADAWLRSFHVKSVIDASAVAFGLDQDRDQAAVAQRKRCLDILKASQKPDGGWGPRAASAPETFDTALAVIVLAKMRETLKLAAPSYSKKELDGAIARGRQYLIQMQHGDGSWQETTRPLPRVSYAQRVSTTAWALEALFRSDANGSNRQ